MAKQRSVQWFKYISWLELSVRQWVIKKKTSPESLPVNLNFQIHLIEGKKCRKKEATFRKVISVQESKWRFVSLPSLTIQNFQASNQLHCSRIVRSSCWKTERLHTCNMKRYLWFMKEVLKLEFHQNFYLDTTFTYTLILNCLNYSVKSSCILHLPPNRSWLMKYLPWENFERKVSCTDWTMTDSQNYSLKFFYINIFLWKSRGWWNIFHGKTLREKWVVRTEWWHRRVLRPWWKRVLTMERWRRRIRRIDTYRVHLKWTTKELARGGLIGYGRLW